MKSDGLAGWFARFCTLGKESGTGSRGENAAARYLTRKCGLRLIRRNWRNRGDLREEIDLICRDREVTVFVEVKTRGSGDVVDGFAAVDRRKKKALRRACRHYLNQVRGEGPDPPFRLDVVVVLLGADGRVSEIRHFPNVPLFS